MGIVSKFKRYREEGKKRANAAKGIEHVPEKEMSFLEHVEELRWHLMRSVVVVMLITILFFINVQWVMDNILLAPFRPEFPTYKWLCKIQLCLAETNVVFQALGPLEQFSRALSMSFIGGFVVAFPYVIWEFWRFIKPGLHVNEKRSTRGAVAVLSFLFFTGLTFSYYVITPFSVSFLSNFVLSPEIKNVWQIGKVVSLVVQIAVGGGIVFELPAVVYVLTRIGVLTPSFMTTYRRHAIVVLLILSAIITPPDVLSQIVIFFPLLLLYEISVLICKRVARKMEKEELAEAEARKKRQETPPPVAPVAPQA